MRTVWRRSVCFTDRRASTRRRIFVATLPRRRATRPGAFLDSSRATSILTHFGGRCPQGCKASDAHFRIAGAARQRDRSSRDSETIPAAHAPGNLWRRVNGCQLDRVTSSTSRRASGSFGGIDGKTCRAT